MTRETRVQQALAECLEALDLHATAEDCLARHPSDSEALRPYLELRSRLRAREVPTAPYAAYKTGRDRMLARIAGNRSSRPGNRPVPGWLRSPFGRATATAALLLLLIGGTISASAAAGVGPSKSMISTALRIAAPQSHDSTPPAQDVNGAPTNESEAIDPEPGVDDSGGPTNSQGVVDDGGGDTVDAADPSCDDPGACPTDAPAEPTPVDEPGQTDSSTSDDRDRDDGRDGDDNASPVIVPGPDQQPVVNSDDSDENDTSDGDESDPDQTDQPDAEQDKSDSNEADDPEDGQEGSADDESDPSPTEQDNSDGEHADQQHDETDVPGSGQSDLTKD